MHSSTRYMAGIPKFFIFALSDPCQMQDNWKLSEGFVAEEAKALLPHRATGRYILHVFNNLCQSASLSHL